jgi:signal transduction histidine kinase
LTLSTPNGYFYLYRSNISHDKTANVKNSESGNLLGNTLQYPSNDGLVRIKIVKWDDFVVMEVTDTGIGVPSNSAAWS